MMLNGLLHSTPEPAGRRITCEPVRWRRLQRFGAMYLYLTKTQEKSVLALKVLEGLKRLAFSCLTSLFTIVYLSRETDT